MHPALYSHGRPGRFYRTPHVPQGLCLIGSASVSVTPCLKGCALLGALASSRGKRSERGCARTCARRDPFPGRYPDLDDVHGLQCRRQQHASNAHHLTCSSLPSPSLLLLLQGSLFQTLMPKYASYEMQNLLLIF